jgi:catechol 2,3-dioxygenase-like lactoylglutathione lyase family enzyme
MAKWDPLGCNIVFPEERKLMIKYNGINHLAMVTGVMDKTIRFWRDLLGMRLVAGLGKPGYRHYFFEISKYDLIAFFEWPHAEPMEEKDHGRPVKGPFIFDHVSLGVETGEDLWQLYDKLQAAGFWVSEIIDHGFIHSLYTFDPNGIPIEFSYNVEGINIRKKPTMVDTEPSDVTKQGPDPHPEEWPKVENPTPPGDRHVYPGEGTELVKGKESEW